MFVFITIVNLMNFYSYYMLFFKKFINLLYEYFAG